jgi:hypothetical protein
MILFVAWCDALEMPRVTLLVADTMVALYLQLVVNRAETFAPVKVTAAAIVFYKKNISSTTSQRSPRRSALCGVLRRGGLASTTRTGKNPLKGSKW